MKDYSELIALPGSLKTLPPTMMPTKGEKRDDDKQTG